MTGNDQERWRRIDGILEAALELPAGECEAFLERSCCGDAELLREVESLLAHDRPDSFLDAPASSEAARLLAGAAAPPLVGQRIGPFEFLGVLGREPEPPSQRRPGLPAALDRVIARALAKDAAGRHTDAAELAADLERLRAVGPAARWLGAAPESVRRLCWRWRWLRGLRSSPRAERRTTARASCRASRCCPSRISARRRMTISPPG